jgi:two-component system nitrogen regulation response regulator GlnG
LFAKVLEVTSGNQSKTAELLGITRGKVRDRIAAFGILLERTVSVTKQ